MIYNAFFSWKPLLLTRIVGVFTFGIPAILFFIESNKRKPKCNLFFTVCIVLILYSTIIRGNVGDNPRVELTPFWSYLHFSEYGIRYQIYMNIFLFIPFGFLLSWAKKWSMAKVVLTGCIFSILIEATQYIFCLGLSEFDDVFHNTLGTALGYWYWRGLENISKKRHPHNQGEENLT